MQIVCMPLHPKTLSSLASFKSRLVLPFYYRLTQVFFLEKKPLNGCSSSSCSSSCSCCCCCCCCCCCVILPTQLLTVCCVVVWFVRRSDGPAHHHLRRGCSSRRHSGHRRHRNLANHASQPITGRRGFATSVGTNHRIQRTTCAVAISPIAAPHAGLL